MSIDVDVDTKFKIEIAFADESKIYGPVSFALITQNN